MCDKANLGLATTRDLLNELTARIELDGNLDYKPAGNLASNTQLVEVPEGRPTMPEGKRVARTKSSGDRVYLLDDTTDPPTRAWVTNAELLDPLGFIMEDVVEVEDSELLKYNMAAPIYKVEPRADA